MFKTLRDAWKVKEIRNKMLYTLFCLFIFRLGSHIPAPFIDKTQIAKIFESAGQSVLGFLDLMAGGSLSNMSIFAMNIYPYITASIIIQLLTVAIPKLEELAKEGMTMIIVSHEMQFAMRVSDKIAFMDSGEIAFLQTPNELRNNDDPRIRRFINNEILRNDFVI